MIVKKNIKWKKGFFRIWVVATAVWLIICTLRVIDGVNVPMAGWELTLVFIVPPALLAIVFFVLPPVYKWIYKGFK